MPGGLNFLRSPPFSSISFLRHPNVLLISNRSPHYLVSSHILPKFGANRDTPDRFCMRLFAGSFLDVAPFLLLSFSGLTASRLQHDHSVVSSALHNPVRRPIRIEGRSFLPFSFTWTVSFPSLFFVTFSSPSVRLHRSAAFGLHPGSGKLLGPFFGGRLSASTLLRLFVFLIPSSSLSSRFIPLFLVFRVHLFPVSAA